MARLNGVGCRIGSHFLAEPTMTAPRYKAWLGVEGDPLEESFQSVGEAKWWLTKKLEAWEGYGPEEWGIICLLDGSIVCGESPEEEDNDF